MLTLMPLSGIHSAIKRRNSKCYDYTRRDSLSVYSSYSLPSSKQSMRRFSSYEELAPIFQLLGAPEESRAKSRRPSITRLIRKHSSVNRERSDEYRRGEAACDALDKQIARVKEQLAQLKSQDIDMSQRVDDLSSSVQDLCNQHRDKIHTSASTKSLTLVRESLLESLDNKSVVEVSDISDSEDEQSFEDYCRTTFTLIGDRRPSSSTINFPSVDIVVQCVDDDPKRHCLLNNRSLRPKAQSTPLLNKVHNDLSEGCKLSKTLSVASDSVLVVTRRKEARKLSFTKTTDL